MKEFIKKKLKWLIKKWQFWVVILVIGIVGNISDSINKQNKTYEDTTETIIEQITTEEEESEKQKETASEEVIHSEEIEITTEEIEASTKTDETLIDENTEVGNTFASTAVELETTELNNLKESSDSQYNFNTYNNESQQKTESSFVLNTNSMKFHYPDCPSVSKIAPQNYSTSNESIETLISYGYSCCGICFK